MWPITRPNIDVFQWYQQIPKYWKMKNLTLLRIVNWSASTKQVMAHFVYFWKFSDFLFWKQTTTTNRKKQKYKRKNTKKGIQKTVLSNCHRNMTTLYFPAVFLFPRFCSFFCSFLFRSRFFLQKQTKRHWPRPWAYKRDDHAGAKGSMASKPNEIVFTKFSNLNNPSPLDW